MKKLPETFHLRKFDWQIVKRHGNVALVSQSFEGEIVAWNVAVIQVEKEGQVFSRFYPERERFPHWNEWGTKAWNYGRDLERAEMAFEKHATL